MENVFAIVYCDGDILSSSKVVLFECPSCSKFITISENMSLDVVRKIIVDAPLKVAKF